MSHEQANKGELIKLPFFKSAASAPLTISKLYFKAFFFLKGEAKKKETNYGESANKLTARWILPKKERRAPSRLSRAETSSSVS